MAKKDLQCSFCGRHTEQVGRLISGPEDVTICDMCVNMCNEIILEKQPEDAAKVNDKPVTMPTPAEIKSYLDEYVIGQDEAKKALAVVVYNHYKRIDLGGQTKKVEIDKSNILFLGPTGTGKTLLAQTLARSLKVPFTIVDATVLTEAGYVGEDVENMLVRLLQDANFDVKAAERGIIYVDEMDKLARKSANPSITRDVSGEGVQQAMLKILEGTVSSIPPKGGRKHPEQNLVKIDTKNILFICGGAFVSLEHIIEKRIGKGSMGFKGDYKSKQELTTELFSFAEPEDLIEFGLIPELVGRIPVITPLKELDEEALKSILLEPKNAIVKQYIELLRLDGVELVIEDSAIKEIVKRAKEKKTGARGLRSSLEKVLTDVMFEVPSNPQIAKVIINGACIKNLKKPKFVLDKKVSKVNKKAS